MDDNEQNEDLTKWRTIYHRRHWGGMTIKRLSWTWMNNSLILQWENGGHVKTRSLLGMIADYLSRNPYKKPATTNLNNK